MVRWWHLQQVGWWEMFKSLPHPKLPVPELDFGLVPPMLADHTPRMRVPQNWGCVQGGLLQELCGPGSRERLWLPRNSPGSG